MLGLEDGVVVGWAETAVGEPVILLAKGACVGIDVGSADGIFVDGALVGIDVGLPDGTSVGSVVGEDVVQI
jgi:hypothetical protein